jgi:hypothetical protein
MGSSLSSFNTLISALPGLGSFGERFSSFIQGTMAAFHSETIMGVALQVVP